MIGGLKQWQVEEVLELLQKEDDLNVCSGSRTMELASALWVNSCCGWCTRTVREPRKENAYLWKPIPKDRSRRAEREDSVRALLNCILCELAIAPLWIVITNWKCPINPVTNPNPKSLQSHTIPRSWQYESEHSLNHTLRYINKSFTLLLHPQSLCKFFLSKRKSLGWFATGV
jgi:hypothetical protein